MGRGSESPFNVAEQIFIANWSSACGAGHFFLAKCALARIACDDITGPLVFYAASRTGSTGYLVRRQVFFMDISFLLNGETVRLQNVSPMQTLLDWLRQERHLTGTKEGCNEGDCGACTVTVDGRLVCACLMLGAEAEGKSIGTVEGIATDEELHPLQQKFIEYAALQCGICTPGILVAAKNLLERNPDPTETEVRYWLAGNLCRCTGYDKIIRAVMDTAAEMREAS